MNYLDKINEKAKFNLKHLQLKILIERLILLNQGNVIREIWKRWEKGLSVNGGEIQPKYRSKEYQAFKKSINPLAGGKVDLTLTGALEEALTIKKQGDKFKIYSTDEKYNKIGKKYGFNEFGLNETEMIEFLEELHSVSLNTILTNIYR